MNGLNLIDDQEKFRHGMELFLKPPEFSVDTTPSEIIYTDDDETYPLYPNRGKTTSSSYTHSPGLS
jgi:hypothetical protein